ncbi:hypothetical protein [Haloarcula sp. K1]|uniref:hypothetical protein n=1 Tax=Haloarcula sp. K1 TaxID=1622207 RepID=UPI0007BC6BA1|nr:hypothetical protein [Haloarcula sp. K1]KZX46335.1 hypothetical protein AV929_16320 [Haloarcula sp. K1]
MAASSETNPSEETELGEYTPPLKQCSCSACDSYFSEQTTIETAKTVVSHWNDEHANILTNSFTPFTTEEVERHVLTEGLSQAREQHLFITVYDVLDTDGADALSKSFVEDLRYEDICVACGTSIFDLEDVSYEELPSEKPFSRHICDACSARRKLKRRKQNNKQLDEWKVDK